MKLQLLTPFWNRPENVQEYLWSLARLPSHTLLAILSPEDPFYFDILDLLPNDTYVTTVENSPFGRKKNAGAEAARTLEWDYLMELNSDSIVNPKLFNLYEEYIEKQTPFFGLNNLFVIEYKTRKSYYIKNYNSGMTYGAGRMVHRTAFRGKIWTDELMEGMDTNMMTRLKKMGVTETVVDSGTIPMIVDLKTDTTLSHITFLKKFAGASEVPYEYISKHIGYDIVSA